MTYKEKQKKRSIDLINNSDIFNGDLGGGLYEEKEIAHILETYQNNLFKPIQEGVETYFKENDISWWGGMHPTGNALSSQIACLNHLFLLRNDKDAVLKIAQTICPDFIDVFRIKTDKFSPGYIQFEAVSKFDHLNEGTPTRGNYCTSIDALLFVKHKNGFKFLVPIEWKYTEIYYNEDKAIGRKGAVRKSRYTDLINNSRQLKSCDHSCYYYEPFYQLMRQTLWTEQMIENKTEEIRKADDYLHIHVIPDNNCDLLCKQYGCSGKKMEETWRDHLSDQSKYKIISPEKLLSNIDRNKYEELIDYLSIRYWNDN